MKTSPIDFIDSFKDMQKTAFRTDVALGLYGDDPYDKSRNIGEITAQLHRDVSDVYSALQGDDQDERDEDIPEFLEAEARLADLIINAMSLAEAYGLKVPEAIVANIIYDLEHR